MTRAFCLPNNSSHNIGSVTEPWMWTAPHPVFATKDLFREYMKKPDTEDCVFSMVEGLTPSLRVSASNPAYRVHGFVANYDTADMTADEIAKAISRIPAHFPPFAYNRTYSGGLRVIWKLEEPIFYYSDDLYKKLIARVVKEFKLKSVAPNLDEHIENGALYYIAYNNWTVNPRAVLPKLLMELMVFDVLKSAKVDGDGPEIPMEVISAEVSRRFPDRWKGDFVEGARGVRFWEPNADANSVILRKNGVVCFTGNEPFVPWAKIFGNELVQAYRASRIGGALSEMYSDGECYYRRLPDGSWDACNTVNARRHLRCNYGLSEKPPKGEDISEIDTVLFQLETRKRVAGALPFPLNPLPSVWWNGQHFLNDSNAKLCPMHPDEQEWGLNFPWIASYLTTLFADEQNLGAFLRWLHVWYASAAAGKPARGQALFIAGPPGTGKTLLTRQILARMFGGYADARAHFVDGGKFNSSMFQKALWCLDDSTMMASAGAHQRYSTMVKAVVANDAMEYEKKYGYQGAVPFDGRLCVTLNNDGMSLDILPNTDISLIDKVTILLTDSCEADVAETEAERYAIIDKELPAFCRWVHDLELARSEKDTRYGVKAWHEPSLLDEARASAPSTTITDVVDDWWSKLCETSDFKEDEKRMTATELYQTLDVNYHSIIGRMSPITLGKHLSTTMANGCPWMSTCVIRGKKYYKFKKI